MTMALFRRSERARQRPKSSTVPIKKPSLNYYSSSPKSQSNTPTRPKHQFRIAKSFKAIIGLAFVALVASSLYLNPSSLTITVAKPSDPAVSLGRAEEVYMTGTKRLMDKAVMSRTKITINTQKLESEIMALFPELESVKIIVPIVGASPKVALKLKQIGLIFSNGSLYYGVDNSGRAILSNLEFPELLGLKVPVVTDQSRPEITSQKYILSSEDVDFIKTLADQLTSNNLFALEYILPNQPNELYVKFNGVGYYAKFNLKTDARTAVGVFLAVKSKLEADAVAPSEYIDVRVEERAYYK